jgi:hypothetical protein
LRDAQLMIEQLEREVQELKNRLKVWMPKKLN